MGFLGDVQDFVASDILSYNVVQDHEGAWMESARQGNAMPASYGSDYSSD